VILPLADGVINFALQQLQSMLSARKKRETDNFERIRNYLPVHLVSNVLDYKKLLTQIHKSLRNEHLVRLLWFTRSRAITRLKLSHLIADAHVDTFWLTLSCMIINTVLYCPKMMNKLRKFLKFHGDKKCHLMPINASVFFSVQKTLKLDLKKPWSSCYLIIFQETGHECPLARG
jgi:hypothetical protein